MYQTFVDQLGKALSDVTEEVVETMFFSTLSPTSDAAGSSTELDHLFVRVRFRGRPSGLLAVKISNRAAATLAENFLGADPDSITATQVDEVVRELANMICGSMLSKLEPDTSFELLAPELLPPYVFAALSHTVSRSFAVENGTLRVLFGTT